MKLGLRYFIRDPFFSAINLFGLVMGFVCGIFILMWVNDELSFDAFHTNGHRLYRVLENRRYTGSDIQTTESTPGILAKAIKSEIPGIERASAATWEIDELFSVGSEAHKEGARYVEPDFLEMFTYPLLKGDSRTALLTPESIVISESMARKFFGAADPMGRQMRVNRGDVRVVTGVLRDIPRTSSISFSCLMPYDTWLQRNQWATMWENNGPRAYILLKEGLDKASVEKSIRGFVQSKRPDPDDANIELLLQSYTDAYLHATFTNGKPSGGRIDYVRSFSVVGILVLLIACINFMNLSTARGLTRAKEIGIRKLQGASRASLALRFIGESVQFALAGLAIALIVVEIALPSFRIIAARDLTPNYGDPLFLLALPGIALTVGLISGSYPALFLAAFDPLQVMRGSLRIGGSTQSVRKGLVVFQFFLTTLLVFCTLVVFEQMRYVREKNLGFDRSQLLELPLEGNLARQWSTLVDEAGRIQGVASATVTTTSPLVGGNTTTVVQWPGQIPDEKVQFTQMSIGYDYVRTMGIIMKAGRDFSKVFGTDTASIVVNEEAARRMRLGDAVGTQITFWGAPRKIIGVMKDYHIASLREPIGPVILHLNPQWSNLLLVRSEPGKTSDAVHGLQTLVARMNPAFPFEFHFVDETFDRQYSRERTAGTLAGIFSLMAVFIATLGLLGLVVFTAEQRIKEIGVRKVLGASGRNIMSLLSKDYLVLVMVACLLAAPLGWFMMNSWLQRFAYRVQISWEVYFASAVVSVLVAVVTIATQSLRSARANPVDALRHE